MIRDELAAHDPALLEKPILVAFNKLDLAAAREAWPAFPARRGPPGIEALAISADTGEGLDELRAAVGGCCPTPRGSRGRPSPRASSCTGWRPGRRRSRSSARTTRSACRGKRIERLVAQTNFDNEESAERFQRELVRTAIDGALRKAGIRPGDAVRIGGSELEWDPPEGDDR